MTSHDLAWFGVNWHELAIVSGRTCAWPGSNNFRGTWQQSPPWCCPARCTCMSRPRVEMGSTWKTVPLVSALCSGALRSCHVGQVWMWTQTQQPQRPDLSVLSFLRLDWRNVKTNLFARSAMDSSEPATSFGICGVIGVMEISWFFQANVQWRHDEMLLFSCLKCKIRLIRAAWDPCVTEPSSIDPISISPWSFGPAFCCSQWHLHKKNVRKLRCCRKIRSQRCVIAHGWFNHLLWLPWWHCEGKGIPCFQL